MGRSQSCVGLIWIRLAPNVWQTSSNSANKTSSLANTLKRVLTAGKAAAAIDEHQPAGSHVWAVISNLDYRILHLNHSAFQALHGVSGTTFRTDAAKSGNNHNATARSR